MASLLADIIDEDPKKLQFITSSHQQIKYSPERKLYEFLAPNEAVLYYNVLNINLSDFENILFIQVDELNSRHQVQKSHSLMLPGDSTYSDLYDSIISKIGLDPEDPDVLNEKRIYCTCDNHVLTIIKPDHYMIIQHHHHNNQINYYVEV